MPRNSLRRLGVVLLFVGGAILAFPGCDDKTQTPDLGKNKDSNVGAPDSLTGLEIFQRVTGRYANAQSYSDRAVLYLSYRLSGRWVQEPQPWAFQWQRTGQFAAELFNSQIVCDGENVSCFVYDIESGNLDNQQVVQKADSAHPFDQLLKDPIAGHFVGGFDDLPIAVETQSAAISQKLIPPTISLLSGQSPLGWFGEGAQIQRLVDDKIGDVDCYVLRLTDSLHVDVWIDKESSTIWQMLLPVALLDSQVLSSRDVSDLQLIARFHEARFDTPLEDKEFAITIRPDANLVSQFVKLPESLPCELIGLDANPFQLFAHEANRKTERDFAGKTTVLIWAVGNKARDVINSTVELARKFAQAEIQFQVLYSNSELEDPDSNSIEAQTELAALLRQTGIGLLFDQDLDASAALRVKAVPAVLVLNKELKVAYARALAGDTWFEDVSTAITRINRGDDLAKEMLDEYRQFLETYHQRLLANAAKQSFAGQLASAGLASPPDAKQMRQQLLWLQNGLQKPGNVYVNSASNEDSLTVFDGWQTLVEIDQVGKISRQSPLGLPENIAANAVRTGTDTQGRKWHAVFMKSGRQAFVFDSEWKQVGVYPSDDSALGPIADCQLADGDKDGRLDLFIAFASNGIHQVDLSTGVGKLVSNLNASSLTSGINTCVSAGKICQTEKDTKQLSVNKLWRWRKLEFVSNKYLGIAEDVSQQTFVIQLNANLEVEWKAPIQAPASTTDSRLIASTLVQSRIIWCVLENPNLLSLFSDSGELIGKIDLALPVNGFALVDLNGQIGLAISSNDGIRMYALSP